MTGTARPLGPSAGLNIYCRAVSLAFSSRPSPGPFTTVMDNLSVPKYQRMTFTLKNAKRKNYRFREAS